MKQNSDEVIETAEGLSIQLASDGGLLIRGTIHLDIVINGTSDLLQLLTSGAGGEPDDDDQQTPVALTLADFDTAVTGKAKAADAAEKNLKKKQAAALKAYNKNKSAKNESALALINLMLALFSLIKKAKLAKKKKSLNDTLDKIGPVIGKALADLDWNQIRALLKKLKAMKAGLPKPKAGSANRPYYDRTIQALDKAIERLEKVPGL
ncbi:hypothetical protein FHS89_002597 [Rubricella aquisinus]|uniref:Uncharacterized protein n=1 Tax=Rubricella aquisinus TaxID=2028108 RepID=A0A840X435_9RHOB|nr:hypothetical protein [Rubricella aquisinus]MBB5516566.1 hypothetical protein [Rubricella aquisinus]